MRERESDRELKGKEREGGGVVGRGERQRETE